MQWIYFDTCFKTILVFACCYIIVKISQWWNFKIHFYHPGNFIFAPYLYGSLQNSQLFRVTSHSWLFCQMFMVHLHICYLICMCDITISSAISLSSVSWQSIYMNICIKSENLSFNIISALCFYPDKYSSYCVTSRLLVPWQTKT